jgi:hypothetical protein
MAKSNIYKGPETDSFPVQISPQVQSNTHSNSYTSHHGTRLEEVQGRSSER